MRRDIDKDGRGMGLDGPDFDKSKLHKVDHSFAGLDDFRLDFNSKHALCLGELLKLEQKGVEFADRRDTRAFQDIPKPTEARHALFEDRYRYRTAHNIPWPPAAEYLLLGH